MRVELDGELLDESHGVLATHDADGLTTLSGRLELILADDQQLVLVRARDDGTPEALRRLKPEITLTSDRLKVSDAIASPV